MIYKKLKENKAAGVGIKMIDINELAIQRFEIDFKPSAISKTHFDIIFHYESGSSVHFQFGSKKKVLSKFSDGLTSQLSGYLPQFFFPKWHNPTWADDPEADRHLLQGIHEAFSISHSDFTYLVAGRSMATAFPDMVEGNSKRIEDKIEEERIKGQDFEAQRRSLNERLFNKFVIWGESARVFFRTNGGSFKTAQISLENGINKNALSQIARIAEAILKGEYSSNSLGSLSV